MVIGIQFRVSRTLDEAWRLLPDLPGLYVRDFTAESDAIVIR
jgi:hypothetical protein